MSARPSLRERLSDPSIVLALGVHDGLTARLAERAGVEAFYHGGYAAAAHHHGLPDIGMVGLEEMVESVRRVTLVSTRPVIVDCDTGYGAIAGVKRTVQEMERAGAGAIQIEDQVFPKRCGHFEGKDVVPLAEMLAKVRAAVDTRRDGDFQIVARTDARAVLGLDAALERAQAMIAAGADATFVEAPTSRHEIGRILRELPAPQIVNIVFGGRTPEMPRSDLAAMGAGLALYANAALQAAIKGAHEVLGALKRDGSLAAIADRLASFEERQRILRKDHFDALERRYPAVE